MKLEVPELMLSKAFIHSLVVLLHSILERKLLHVSFVCLHSILVSGYYTYGRITMLKIANGTKVDT